MTVTTALVREATGPDLETSINAALLGVLTARIIGVQVDALRNTPSFTKNLYCSLTFDTHNATVILTPYQIKVVSASSDADVQTLLDAFVAAHPTYFYAPVLVLYRPDAVDPNSTCLGLLFYHTDATSGYSNWGYSP